MTPVTDATSACGGLQRGGPGLAALAYALLHRKDAMK